MTADDDFKLLHFGIGFTNMVARPTKGSADLTRKEIREGKMKLLSCQNENVVMTNFIFRLFKVAEYCSKSCSDTDPK